MATSSRVFTQLEQQQYIALRTFRQNGEAVDTPVWFAEHEGIIYIETSAYSGKVKRIKQNPNVKVIPCNLKGDLLGPAMPGRAHIITITQEMFQAKGALHHKYGFTRQAYYFVIKTIALVRKHLESAERRAYIAIEPELIV
jgi:PPOX class probable F420-dependent enzyme